MLDSQSLRTQVVAELRPFVDISRSLNQLISHKHFDMLAEVLAMIHQAETAFDKSRHVSLKEHLKVIVPCMINGIWGGTRDKSDSSRLTQVLQIAKQKSPSPNRISRYTDSPTTDRPRSPTKHYGSYDERSRRSSPSRFGHDFSETNLNKSLMGLSYQEANSLSDFCQIKGHATFTKSKRTLTRGNDRSPGPAAYRGERLHLQASSPKLTIPKGGKKGELFSPPYSPGPAAYYVMRHYLSKPS